MNFLDLFALKLREKRIQQKITQRGLAEKLNMCTRTIIQRLDGRQLLEAKPIKIVLCGLVDRDLAFMLCKKFLGVPGLAIGNVGIAGLGITHDTMRKACRYP